MNPPKPWSSTQASRFLLCRRAWAFEYVEGVKRPSSKSTELGRDVHGVLECHLKRESLDKQYDEQVEAIARAMSRCLPTGRVLSVERERRRGRWRGFIDLEYEPAPGVVGVSDHKTRKSLKKYVPTEEQLALDLQATVYVYLVAGVCDLAPDAVVPLWWTFGQTEGAAKARAVRSALQVAEAERRVALLDRAVVVPGDALRAARAPANTIEPNPAACNRYGGCPYRERCALTAEQRLLGMIQEQQQQENDMSETLWQDLATQFGDQVGGPYTGVNRPAADYAAQATPQGQGQPPNQPSYSAPPQLPSPAPSQGQGQLQVPSQLSAPSKGQGQLQVPSQLSYSAPSQVPSQPQVPSQLSYSAPSQVPSQPSYSAPPQAPSQPSYSAPSQVPNQPSYSAPPQAPSQGRPPSPPSASYSAPSQAPAPSSPSDQASRHESDLLREIVTHANRAGYFYQGLHESDAGRIIGGFSEGDQELLAFDGQGGVFGLKDDRWQQLTWTEAAERARSWPDKNSKSGRGFILLVGCTAQGARNIAPLLREANARASVAAGVPDYRAVEYGRGPGLFLAHLRPLLDEHLGEGVVVEADPNSPEVKIALVELEARASLTVRGY